MVKNFWLALGGDAADLERLSTTGHGSLSAAFPVSDLAVAAISTAALSISELLHTTLSLSQKIRIDRRLASLWFKSSIRPINWSVPAPWDALAGDYLASDGWIRLHTNAPHHRRAVEQVLGGVSNRMEVARAVARWSKRDLEQAILDARGCAAEMRSYDEWKLHPQGIAVAKEKLADINQARKGSSPEWTPNPRRPLDGIKVLDLTRVLAGPVATRFLAGYGADVLRIDPPDWDEPAVIPDVILGKRCARLDLRNNEHRAIFEELLSEADIVLHGYRPGALDGLGYAAQVRHKIAPNIIDVSLNAYGWTGPWSHRRGFDSLVQMSTGIADAGMKWKRSSEPVPLPVQALDHATGYLLAAAAIRGLTSRLVDGVATDARLSLARTANELLSRPRDHDSFPLEPATGTDFASEIESTPWGPAQRLSPPAEIDGAPMRWDFPSALLGSSPPTWLSAN